MKLTTQLPTLNETSGLTEQGQTPKSLSVLMMSPASLTPLIPPFSGEGATPAHSDGDIAAQRRQTLFTEKQASLLDKLQSSTASPNPPQASVLSAAQRGACIAVLTTVATAVMAAD